MRDVSSAPHFKVQGFRPNMVGRCIGESGRGKSTLARMITLIEKPSAGMLTLDAVDAVDPPASAAKALRRTVQIVFQNPYGSLLRARTAGGQLLQNLIFGTHEGSASLKG